MAHYARRGVEAVYLAEFGPLNFGCFVEVLEREPGAQKLFASVAEAAMNWDGRDPIRHIG